MVALFAVLAVALAVVAISAGSHGQCPIAIGAGVIAAWLLSMALGALRRRGR